MCGDTILFNASLKHDKLAGVDSRLMTGPGLGYYLIKDKTHQLTADISATYIREDLEQAQTDDVFSVRFSERYQRKLSKTASWWESLEYLPNAEDFDDYLNQCRDRR